VAAPAEQQYLGRRGLGADELEHVLESVFLIDLLAYAGEAEFGRQR